MLIVARALMAKPEVLMLDEVTEGLHPSLVDRLSEGRVISTGWGGRDRTSEWRNQNQLDYSTISRRIWKKAENAL
jgi:hypothetical protein